MITVKQAAVILGKSDRQVRWYTSHGLLKKVEVNPRLFFLYRKDVEKFVPPPRGNPLFGPKFGNAKKKKKK